LGTRNPLALAGAAVRIERPATEPVPTGRAG